MIYPRGLRLVVCLLLTLSLTPAWALAEQGPGTYAVASAHPLATQAGLEMLQAGGNAFDAAVAITAAIAVVEPAGSGIGGGGFWLLHRAADGLNVFVDGRETAPAAATADMYLDENGKAIADLSRFGALAGGIPGEPAALDHLATRYGRLSLAQALQPAIRYAREGFVCDAELAEKFAFLWDRFSPAAKQTFGVDGQPPAEGALLRQPDLARTLELMAEHGAKGFYQGETARRMVEGVRAAGGIWTAEDLRRYRVIEREPTELQFRDVRVITAPPPSAGGITLGEVLNQLEVIGWGGTSLESRHLVIEAMRRGYRDRASYLGDPDYVHIPARKLLSRSYARQLAEGIDAKRATPSADLPESGALHEGQNTTHFSVLDAAGNRVAATLSINLWFGSSYMPPGTGVFVNDEMDDFAASLTASNAYGLIGSKANAIAPGKRPLSSMSPTFVEGPRGLLVLGTPGGSRIITMVLLGILDWTQGASVAQIVAQPRYHHQYLPDRVEFEPDAFTAQEQSQLQAMGHTLEPVTRLYGNMQAVVWEREGGVVQAASDPRGIGEAVVVPAAELARTP